MIIVTVFESEKSKLPEAIGIVWGLAVIVLLIIGLFITSLIAKQFYSRRARGVLSKIKQKHEKTVAVPLGKYTRVKPGM